MTRQHLITACILITATALAMLGIWLIQTPQQGTSDSSDHLDRPSSVLRSATPSAAPKSPQSQGERDDDPDALAAPEGGLSATQARELESAAKAFVTSYHRRSFDDPEATTWLADATEYCTPEMAHELKTKFSSDGGLQWSRFVEGRSTTTASIRRTTPSHNKHVAKGQATVIVDYTVSTRSEDPMVAAADTTFVRTVDLVRTDGQWKVSAITNLSGEPTA